MNRFIEVRDQQSGFGTFIDVDKICKITCRGNNDFLVEFGGSFIIVNQIDVYKIYNMIGIQPNNGSPYRSNN